MLKRLQLLRCGHKTPEEFFRFCAYGLNDLDKLDDIQTTLAIFVFGYVRLGPADTRS